MTNKFLTVEQAIEDFQQGKMVVLVDDEQRENEGDLIIAAEFITADVINFMNREVGGLICLAMTESLVDHLEIPMMVSNNQSQYQTPFTASIEAQKGVTTGISAKDRAHTIKVAISPSAVAGDIVSPGHIFPLKAKANGVLKRQGHTEGSVDLAKLAGLRPASVICEVVNDDGTMARHENLFDFANKHSVGILTIKSLVDYRIATEQLVDVTASSHIPLDKYGQFEFKVFSNSIDEQEHFALIKPPVKANAIPLVRVHSECITGEVFGSLRCDCGSQLHNSLKEIAKHGGVFIYLRQEGRGIGLANKIKAYALQEQGMDTVEANVELGLPVDNREFSVAYQILKHLGISHVKLLTNNPDKIRLLVQYGLVVTQRVPLITKATEHNYDYLAAKQNKLGHLIELEN